MPGVELSASGHRGLADLVLAVHVGVVVFVVGGLVLIVLANALGARGRLGFVNRIGFRLAHLIAIAVVVAESWLGIACPLTTLEQALRTRAGAASPGAGRGFVADGLSRLLYYDAPAWVFTLGYSVFGLIVLATWRRFPPDRGGRAGR
jgi:polyferredoxin